MRAAAILGLGCSEKDLVPFKTNSNLQWRIGLPESSSDADAILIFGGDGTIHRHLAQLVRLELPVLVVPRGSGNDFARALGLRTPNHASSAWKAFVSGAGNVRTIDLGVISPLDATASTPQPQHYFCCVGGVGLDAEIARRANQMPRWLRGFGGYALSLFRALPALTALRMKITTSANSSPEELSPRSDQPTILAAFANAPMYGGGMKIAPNAQLDDSQLDICLISDIDRFKLFCLFPTIYFGRHLRVPEVEYFKAARLRIETEHPQDVYADGEYVCRTPIEASVAPKVLRIISPQAR